MADAPKTTGTLSGTAAYRWIIVAAAAVMLAMAMGLLVNGLSVFFLPLELEYGWARGDIGLINTAGLAGLATGGALMGRFADRFGIRPVCAGGAVALGLCLLAASQAQSLAQFYVLFFLAGAFGGAAFFAPLVAMVGGWFVTGAGMAIGIVSAGQALGQGALPLVSALLIEDLGWRGAFGVLGGVTLALLVPLALVVRDPPRPAAAAPGAPAEAPATPLPHRLVIGALCAAVLGCCTCMSVPLMHLVPYMQGCGVGAADAGGVMFAMLCAGIAGRLFFGQLADRIGGVRAYLVASAWQTVMVFGFTFFQELDGFYLYAVLYGFGYAGVMTGVLTATRALSPASRRGSAMGLVTSFGFIGHGIGGWVGGMLFDLTGAYQATFALAALAGAANLVIVGSLALGIRRAEARAVPA
ncbi:MAG: MFS transporter [Rhodobacteraceae bacterium]|nr:MFS transporter [Paracoccaceae bacterium]